jgi:hypothetical protein
MAKLEEEESSQGASNREHFSLGAVLIFRQFKETSGMGCHENDVDRCFTKNSANVIQS